MSGHPNSSIPAYLAGERNKALFLTDVRGFEYEINEETCDHRMDPSLFIFSKIGKDLSDIYFYVEPVLLRPGDKIRGRIIHGSWED